MVDLTGQVFNRLTVLKLDTERKSKGSSYWICRCDCGKIKSIKSSSLRRGEIQSCGCLRNEHIQKIGKNNLKDLVKLKENLTEAEFRIKAGLALDVEKEVENALFRN